MNQAIAVAAQHINQRGKTMNQKNFSALKGFFVSTAIILSGVCLTTPSAYATNGYFADAYSVNSQGLVGAGVALPMDSLDAAINPANMVFIGKRYDVGLSFFNPNRQYTVTGGGPGPVQPATGTVESDSRWFVIPSIGMNWMLNADSSAGVSIYGNGGMNTDYPKNTFSGASPAGVDLMQLFITPSYARKLAEKHAVGIAPILAYQRFSAKGLQAFAAASSDPNNLTNNGYDDSYGMGAKIGYQGEVLPSLNLGASYQTKIYMTKLDKYRGLFAEQGSFDIPSTWTVGLAYKTTPALVFLFDVQRINYSGVKAIANSVNSPGQLGNDNGPGFGWKDMTIYRLAAQWKSSNIWTWRAGYSTGNQPIPNSEVLFNILAPAVIQQHAAIGFTRAMSDTQDLSFALTRAFPHTVSGTSPAAYGGQNIELKMDQWQIATAYAWKF